MSSNHVNDKERDKKHRHRSRRRRERDLERAIEERNQEIRDLHRMYCSFHSVRFHLLLPDPDRSPSLFPRLLLCTIAKAMETEKVNGHVATCSCHHNSSIASYHHLYTHNFAGKLETAQASLAEHAQGAEDRVPRPQGSAGDGFSLQAEMGLLGNTARYRSVQVCF